MVTKMICMDPTTFRKYYVVKRHAVNGMFTEWPTGKRYNLVKVYI